MRATLAIACLLVACDTSRPAPTCLDLHPPTDASARPLPDGAWHDGAGDVWVGTIEDLPLPSGSTRVRIVLDAAPPGDGPRTGVVIFGAGPPPPRATNPDVGYQVNVSGFVRIAEGFAYPLRTGLVEGARVRVTIDLASLWSDWCAMQTPFPASPDDPRGGFECAPSMATVETPDGPNCCFEDGSLINCQRLSLCRSRVCACTETACQEGDLFEILIDFRVDGTSGVGTADVFGRSSIELTLAE